MSTPATTATTTGSFRLQRGEIPSTWTKPAEVVSTLPQPARRPIVTGVLVGGGVVACVLLALVLVPTSPTASLPPPAPAPVAPVVAPVVAPTVAPAPPAPAPAPVVDAIPAPPPTSSTKPGPVAPEDQGGDAVAPAKDSAKDPHDVVSELPARKKAKIFTTRAIVQLRDGNPSGAEPQLVRAVLVDPSYADAWRHLGIARAQLGDKDGARRAYRKYLSLAPNAPDAAQLRAILAQ